ncbi:hypothetical protein BGX26_001695, partial [Mortierella sp. AD094]
MADHGYPEDVKVNVTEDNDNSPPPPFTENELAQPLLATEKGQASTDQAPAEPHSLCEKRAKYRKALKIFRVVYAVFLLLWLVRLANLAFFSDDGDTWVITPYPNYDLPKDFTPTWSNPVLQLYRSLDVFNLKDMFSDKCTDDLVPWEGPSSIETNLQTIRLGFDEGNIVSNVTVRSGNVKIPTILIRASVTK